MGTLTPFIVAIDHVGMAVPDLDAAIALHEERLGAVLVHRERNADQGVEEAMLRVGDGPAKVQLLAPLDDRSPIAAFLDRRGPGLQQVAYQVTDVLAACAALRDAGLHLVYEHPRAGTAGSSINFVHPRSTGGILLELVQPACPGTSAVLGTPTSGSTAVAEPR